MACNGICYRYRVTKPHTEKDGRYENGQKRCNECNIFIMWNGNRCPCCGIILRLKPRSGKTRRVFMDLQQKPRI